ncbi:MAG: glycosyltransferase family 39 protein [Verrucomicrobiales bacterium]
MKLEEARSLWFRARPLALPACLCLFVLFCIGGLNPYFRPDYHDNITYYVAAESLLAGDGYTFEGAPIADWPPVTSVIFAGVFAIFGPSVIVAKLISITAAVIAVILASQLLRREERPDRLKTIAIFCLTPVALLTATTVASDWICAAFSFGCLLALSHLYKQRGLPLAVATGLLLGLAALTRQTGVLLGAAIVFQALIVCRRRGIRAVLPEFLAAATGAAMYLGWGAYTAAQLAKQPPLTGNYATYGLSLFSDFSLSELMLSIFDVFCKWDDVLEKVGVPAGLTVPLLIIPTLILAAGLISNVRRNAIHPSDVYALAFLALLFGYHWKLSRYLLPIAPFLIAWFIAGLRCTGSFLANLPWGRQQRFYDSAINGFAGLWLACLIPLNAFVLFNQSGNGLHRGISVLASPSPDAYYQGRWADLHAGCQAILADGQPGAVASSGFYLRYTKAFTKRAVIDTERSPNDPAGYAIFVADSDYSDPSEFYQAGDLKIYETDKVTVFRRSQNQVAISEN